MATKKKRAKKSSFTEVVKFRDTTEEYEQMIKEAAHYCETRQRYPFGISTYIRDLLRTHPLREVIKKELSLFARKSSERPNEK